MTKILLTGGSGFIAAHILEQLLAKNHTVITTVRSQAKADTILAAHKAHADRLSVAVVGDIARPGAFNDVVAQHGDGLEVVLHTASPFHFKFTDARTELINPAVVGTVGILHAIKASAPSVRRVVVTSSFAAILDAKKLNDPATTFTEKSWNPARLEDIEESPAMAYRVSKTLAERAAWDFVRDEKPNFDLVTVNPPLVLGPVVHHLATLDTINTSNERVVQLLSGKWKEGIPDTGPVVLWIDVRDVATAHVKAMENPAAGGHRLYTVGGRFTNKEIADIVRKGYPAFKDKLPGPDTPGGGCPPDTELFKFNTDETNKILGIDWIPLEKSLGDLVESLKQFDL
ncbi:methylglyoxal reductase (NADPH-dependent) gre2 [Lecanicillium sp. MT-2017a]|nr:methylglyoxal reductase (NADPH-dependent) gre2 [Lecanicillium sp. MT-2017a]